MAKMQKETVHETAERLISAVEELHPNESNTAAIAKRLGVGDNMVTNWKAADRGVSTKGAILAEAAYGIPAAWIMYGERPPIKNTWPFGDRVNYERVRRLSKEDLIFLAGKIDGALDELENKYEREK